MAIRYEQVQQAIRTGTAAILIGIVSKMVSSRAKVLLREGQGVDGYTDMDGFDLACNERCMIDGWVTTGQGE